MSKRKLMMIAVAAGIVGMMTGCSIFNEGEALSDEGKKDTGIKNTGIEDEAADDTTKEGEESSAEKEVESEDETTKVDTAENHTTENNTEAKNETSNYVLGGDYETNANGEISYNARVNFENAAFLGDSRTAGLDEKLVVGQADFYTSIGIDVRGVLQKKVFTLSNGQKGTMLEAVSEKNYDKIYLMFGINELGWPYKDTFVQYYTTIIETLKQRFPNAEIYVQSIIPMVEKRTDEVYNNEKIALFNTYIEEVAKNTEVNWINVNSAVTDEAGALPEEASSDGIHLNRYYLFKWADYLKYRTYS